jgi:hypothetical protein
MIGLKPTKESDNVLRKFQQWNAHWAYTSPIYYLFSLWKMFWENAKLQSVSCMQIYIVGPTGIPNIYRTITLANIFILVIQLFDFVLS